MTTNAEMLRCVQRELKMRRRVYPRFVASGKMSVVTSDYEIKTMEAIEAVFRTLVDAEQRNLFSGEGIA